MPNVLHVTPYLDPTAGGPPVVVERLIEGAAGNGFSASILTTADYTGDRGAALRTRDGEITVLDGQLSALSGNGRRSLKAAVAAADIVHLHTLWSPLVDIAAVEARRQRVPYVLSPHGMLDPQSLRQKVLKKRLYFHAIAGRTLGHADCILFTTEEESELARGMAGLLPRATVISLGADSSPERTEVLAAKFREAHPEFGTGPFVIFLGRVHAKKRPEAVIAALPAIRESAPHAALLIAGSGDPAKFANLRAQAARLGLGDAVHFLGHLAGDAKWQALAAASVFALPSKQENFAIAAAEALQSGVPALLTRRVNIWREVVEAGAGFIVNESNLVAELASQATSLLGDAALHSRMSAAARDLAARAYSWPASAAATHALYRRILSPCPPEVGEAKR